MNGSDSEVIPGPLPAGSGRERQRAWEAYNADRAEVAHRTARRIFGEAVALEAWRGVWSGACFGCGKLPAEGVDHIVPKSRGGRNALENLQPACLPCNVSKGAR